MYVMTDNAAQKKLHAREHTQNVVHAMATKMRMMMTMGRRWPGRRQAVEEEVEVRTRAADWRRKMTTAMTTTTTMTMTMTIVVGISIGLKTSH